MSWRDVIRGGTDLVVPQGTSWSRRFEFLDASGEPVDLTAEGWSAKADLRIRKAAPEVLYTWSSDTANLDMTADGELILTLEPEETASWVFRRGVWDLEVTDPDGVVTRLAEGRLRVTREVTRA